jgi:hypothetical protein
LYEICPLLKYMELIVVSPVNKMTMTMSFADKAMFKATALSRARALGSSPFKMMDFSKLCEEENKRLVEAGDIPREGVPKTHQFNLDELGMEVSGKWKRVRVAFTHT